MSLLDMAKWIDVIPLIDRKHRRTVDKPTPVRRYAGTPDIQAQLREVLNYLAQQTITRL